MGVFLRIGHATPSQGARAPALPDFWNPTCVARWPSWTCNQQLAGSNTGFPTVECNPGQVVNTHMPLSPNSIIWYQPTGGDALQLVR